MFINCIIFIKLFNFIIFVSTILSYIEKYINIYYIIKYENIHSFFFHFCYFIDDFSIILKCEK